MTSGPHTIGWRAANSDLGSIGDPGVCDTQRRATFSELTSLFHGLCANLVLLNNAEGSALIDPRRKAKSSLASATIERTCVHGSQSDKDQRQEGFRGEHGSSADGSEGLVLALKLSGLTFIKRKVEIYLHGHLPHKY